MSDEDLEVCPKAKDGKHKLSQTAIEVCKEIPPGGWEGSILVDVWCDLCGRSGATMILPADVQW